MIRFIIVGLDFQDFWNIQKKSSIREPTGFLYGPYFKNHGLSLSGCMFQSPLLFQNPLQSAYSVATNTLIAFTRIYNVLWSL